MHINQVITLLTFVVLALLLATGIYLVWDGSYGAFGILVMSLAVGFAGLLHLSFLEASNALEDEQTREREWQEFKKRCSDSRRAYKVTAQEFESAKGRE